MGEGSHHPLPEPADIVKFYKPAVIFFEFMLEGGEM
jgi:hypothetical protein